MLSHFSCTQLFETLRSPLFIEFSKEEYWSRLHALFQRIFPTQEWKLHLISYVSFIGRQVLYPLGSPTYMHIYSYIGVLTLDLLQQAKIQIPINKRMVKDGIYACSQLLNLGLPHCRQILYHLSHQGSPLYKCSTDKFQYCFPGGSEVKASACTVGDLSLITGSGRSPGEGNGNPLQ